MTVASGESETFGVTGSELGTYSVEGRSITGTANKVTVPNWGGVGVSEQGYFIYLHFDNAKRFYNEKQPGGVDFDETGHVLFRLGTDAPSATWFEVEDVNGVKIRYSISVTAAVPMRARATRSVAKSKTAKES